MIQHLNVLRNSKVTQVPSLKLACDNMHALKASISFHYTNACGYSQEVALSRVSRRQPGQMSCTERAYVSPSSLACTHNLVKYRGNIPPQCHSTIPPPVPHRFVNGGLFITPIPPFHNYSTAAPCHKRRVTCHPIPPFHSHSTTAPSRKRLVT